MMKDFIFELLSWGLSSSESDQVNVSCFSLVSGARNLFGIFSPNFDLKWKPGWNLRFYKFWVWMRVSASTNSSDTSLVSLCAYVLFLPI